LPIWISKLTCKIRRLTTEVNNSYGYRVEKHLWYGNLQKFINKLYARSSFPNKAFKSMCLKKNLEKSNRYLNFWRKPSRIFDCLIFVIDNFDASLICSNTQISKSLKCDYFLQNFTRRTIAVIQQTNEASFNKWWTAVEAPTESEYRSKKSQLRRELKRSLKIKKRDADENGQSGTVRV
jgi:hypothetical protein